VIVADDSEGARFAGRVAGGLGALSGDQLERDAAIKGRISSEIDRSHAPLAELALDLPLAEANRLGRAFRELSLHLGEVELGVNTLTLREAPGTLSAELGRGSVVFDASLGGVGWMSHVQSRQRRATWVVVAGLGMTILS
jgi:hypothetical protein